MREAAKDRSNPLIQGETMNLRGWGNLDIGIYVGTHFEGFNGRWLFPYDCDIEPGTTATMCKLSVTPHPLGREISFEIPEDLSGREIVDRIDLVYPGVPGHRVFESTDLRNDPRLVEKGIKRTLIFADKLDISGEIEFCLCDMQKLEDREKILGANGLKSEPRYILALAGILLRDRVGFPEDLKLIGTKNDLGDIFLGEVAYGGDGLMGTPPSGITDKIDPDRAKEKRVLVGSLI